QRLPTNHAPEKNRIPCKGMSARARWKKEASAGWKNILSRHAPISNAMAGAAGKTYGGSFPRDSEKKEKQQPAHNRNKPKALKRIEPTTSERSNKKRTHGTSSSVHGMPPRSSTGT